MATSRASLAQAERKVDASRLIVNTILDKQEGTGAMAQSTNFDVLCDSSTGLITVLSDLRVLSKEIWRDTLDSIWGVVVDRLTLDPHVSDLGNVLVRRYRRLYQ
jgi:hypothetical protein